MERLYRSEAANELREQAAPYRRLAKTARTTRGSSALTRVGGQFDDDARRWGGYRYSNARDALAAARRNTK